MNKHVAIALVAGLMISGCGKSKDKDEGEGGGAAPAGAKAGKTKEHKLALGVTADLPSDVDTSSESMLTGRSIGAMSIDVASTKQTLDEAKSDASMYSPQNLKGEALADGWVLTFDNKGEMGASYFLQVQRDIAGKTIRCSTTQPTGDRIGTVLAVCKSLRP